MKYEVPYLIAEIGINHNGHLNKALELIDQAVAAGWNMVKFQKRDPDICVPEDQKNKPKIWEGQKMTYLEYKKKIEFGYEEYQIINQYCKEKGIDWTVSVWDIPSAKFMIRYFKDDIPFIKIPSACITDMALLRFFKNNCPDMPLLISDGMSDIFELRQAIVEIPNLYGVLHCNSSYPAKYNELDISFIGELKKSFNNEYSQGFFDRYPLVGYSGHEENFFLSCPLALACGADIIEKHVTLDKTMEGSDHSCSMEPQEMKHLKVILQGAVDMLGAPGLRCYPSEEEVKKKLRKY